MPPTSLPRRTLLGSGAALGASALLTASPGQANAAPRLVAAAPADRLVESFGVVIHLHFLKSVYGRHDEVLRWLRRLGVRHVRTRLSILPDVMDAMAEYARHGIRIQGVCGAFGDDQSMDHVMRAVARRFDRPHDVFSAFEGINEPNNDGVPWVAETRARTRELHRARSAHGLRRIPIVAPALARVTSGGVEGDNTWEQAKRLGDLSRYVDLGNMHVYPRGLPPSADIDHFRRCARRVAGPGRVMCTEGGYFTAMDYRGGANPVPSAVAAAYAPQQVLEHWRARTLRFFRYELLDEPDATSTDREGTLGMVRTGRTWRPKKDFRPLRHLLATLSDPGGGFEPAPIRMALVGGPKDLRHAVFAKRDGSHVLALWRDRPIYDPRRQRLLVRDLAEPMADVRLELGSARDISVRHLTDLRSSPVRRTGRRIGVDLTPGVTLVTLR